MFKLGTSYYWTPRYGFRTRTYSYITCDFPFYGTSVMMVQIYNDDFPDQGGGLDVQE